MGYYFFIITTLLLWINFIVRFNKLDDLYFSSSLVIVCSAIFLLCAFALKRMAAVEYDGNKLYYSGRRKVEINIDDIVEVKLTMIDINGISMWKLKYLEEEKVMAVRIFFNSSPNFVKFIKQLKEKNIKVVQTSNSFDFECIILMILPPIIVNS